MGYLLLFGAVITGLLIAGLVLPKRLRERWVK